MDTSEHLDLLMQAGLSVLPIDSRDVIIDGVTPARVLVRTRIPSPENIHRDLQAAGRELTLLYLLPRTNPTILKTAQTSPRVAVVGLSDRTVVFRGRVVSLNAAQPANATVHRRPWGRFATARELIRHRGTAMTQSAISTATGVTQAAVSKALHVLRSGNLFPVDPRITDGPNSLRRLIDYAIDEYPGPAGITSHWYSLDTPRETANELRHVLAEAGALLGGDLAADEYAPWKMTSRLAIYSPVGIDFASLGLAEASRNDANIVCRIPADFTIFNTARSWSRDGRPEFTDPIITAWELTQSRDSDSDQAIDQLRRFLERGRSAF